ncbi:MAG TPA: hypothetical protein PKE20_12490 [Promineifilum sp.]|nr:hypothetical protein [Promineifilum sp.]
MIPFHMLLQHSLFYGAILSIAMTALILGSLYWRPMIWIGDAPAEIRAVAPPMSESDRRAKRLAGLVMLGIFLAVLVASVLGLRGLAAGQPSFADVALSTFIVFMTFNVVDLLIIDWLLVVTVRPSFVMIPGTEGMDAYGDYGFHFHAFLKGTAGGVVLALIVGAVAVLLL